MSNFFKRMADRTLGLVPLVDPAPQSHVPSAEEKEGTREEADRFWSDVASLGEGEEETPPPALPEAEEESDVSDGSYPDEGEEPYEDPAVDPDWELSPEEADLSDPQALPPEFEDVLEAPGAHDPGSRESEVLDEDPLQLPGLGDEEPWSQTPAPSPDEREAAVGEAEAEADTALPQQTGETPPITALDHGEPQSRRESKSRRREKREGSRQALHQEDPTTGPEGQRSAEAPESQAPGENTTATPSSRPETPAASDQSRPPATASKGTEKPAASHRTESESSPSQPLSPQEKPARKIAQREATPVRNRSVPPEQSPAPAKEPGLSSQPDSFQDIQTRQGQEREAQGPKGDGPNSKARPNERPIRVASPQTSQRETGSPHAPEPATGASTPEATRSEPAPARMTDQDPTRDAREAAMGQEQNRQAISEDPMTRADAQREHGQERTPKPVGGEEDAGEVREAETREPRLEPPSRPTRKQKAKPQAHTRAEAESKTAYEPLPPIARRPDQTRSRRAVEDETPAAARELGPPQTGETPAAHATEPASSRVDEPGSRSPVASETTPLTQTPAHPKANDLETGRSPAKAAPPAEGAQPANVNFKAHSRSEKQPGPIRKRGRGKTRRHMADKAEEAIGSTQSQHPSHPQPQKRSALPGSGPQASTVSRREGAPTPGPSSQGSALRGKAPVQAKKVGESLPSQDITSQQSGAPQGSPQSSTQGSHHIPESRDSNRSAAHSLETPSTPGQHAQPHTEETHQTPTRVGKTAASPTQEQARTPDGIRETGVSLTPGKQTAAPSQAPRSEHSPQRDGTASSTDHAPFIADQALPSVEFKERLSQPTPGTPGQHGRLETSEQDRKPADRSRRKSRRQPSIDKPLAPQQDGDTGSFKAPPASSRLATPSRPEHGTTPRELDQPISAASHGVGDDGQNRVLSTTPSQNRETGIPPMEPGRGSSAVSQTQSPQTPLKRDGQALQEKIGRSPAPGREAHSQQQTLQGEPLGSDQTQNTSAPTPPGTDRTWDRGTQPESQQREPISAEPARPDREPVGLDGVSKTSSQQEGSSDERDLESTHGVGPQDSAITRSGEPAASKPGTAAPPRKTRAPSPEHTKEASQTDSRKSHLETRQSPQPFTQPGEFQDREALRTTAGAKNQPQLKAHDEDIDQTVDSKSPQHQRPQEREPEFRRTGAPLQTRRSRRDNQTREAITADSPSSPNVAAQPQASETTGPKAASPSIPASQKLENDRSAEPKSIIPDQPLATRKTGEAITADSPLSSNAAAQPQAGENTGLQAASSIPASQRTGKERSAEPEPFPLDQPLATRNTEAGEPVSSSPARPWATREEKKPRPENREGHMEGTPSRHESFAAKAPDSSSDPTAPSSTSERAQAPTHVRSASKAPDKARQQPTSAEAPTGVVPEKAHGTSVPGSVPPAFKSSQDSEPNTPTEHVSRKDEAKASRPEASSQDATPPRRAAQMGRRNKRQTTSADSPSTKLTGQQPPPIHHGEIGDVAPRTRPAQQPLERLEDKGATREARKKENGTHKPATPKVYSEDQRSAATPEAKGPIVPTAEDGGSREETAMAATDLSHKTGREPAYDKPRVPSKIRETSGERARAVFEPLKSRSRQRKKPSPLENAIHRAVKKFSDHPEVTEASIQQGENVQAPHSSGTPEIPESQDQKAQATNQPIQVLGKTDQIPQKEATSGEETAIARPHKELSRPERGETQDRAQRIQEPEAPFTMDSQDTRETRLTEPASRKEAFMETPHRETGSRPKQGETADGAQRGKAPEIPFSMDPRDTRETRRGLPTRRTRRQDRLGARGDMPAVDSPRQAQTHADKENRPPSSGERVQGPEVSQTPATVQNTKTSKSVPATQKAGPSVEPDRAKAGTSPSNQPQPVKTRATQHRTSEKVDLKTASPKPLDQNPAAPSTPGEKTRKTAHNTPKVKTKGGVTPEISEERPPPFSAQTTANQSVGADAIQPQEAVKPQGRTSEQDISPNPVITQDVQPIDASHSSLEIPSKPTSQIGPLAEGTQTRSVSAGPAQDFEVDGNREHLDSQANSDDGSQEKPRTRPPVRRAALRAQRREDLNRPSMNSRDNQLLNQEIGNKQSPPGTSSHAPSQATEAEQHQAHQPLSQADFKPDHTGIRRNTAEDVQNPAGETTRAKSGEARRLPTVDQNRPVASEKPGIPQKAREEREYAAGSPKRETRETTHGNRPQLESQTKPVDSVDDRLERIIQDIGIQPQGTEAVGTQSPSWEPESTAQPSQPMEIRVQPANVADPAVPVRKRPGAPMTPGEAVHPDPVSTQEAGLEQREERKEPATRSMGKTPVSPRSVSTRKKAPRATAAIQRPGDSAETSNFQDIQRKTQGSRRKASSLPATSQPQESRTPREHPAAPTPLPKASQPATARVGEKTEFTNHPTSPVKRMAGTDDATSKAPRSSAEPNLRAQPPAEAPAPAAPEKHRRRAPLHHAEKGHIPHATAETNQDLVFKSAPSPKRHAANTGRVKPFGEKPGSEAGEKIHAPGMETEQGTQAMARSTSSPHGQSMAPELAPPTDRKKPATQTAPTPAAIDRNHAEPLPSPAAPETGRIFPSPEATRAGDRHGTPSRQRRAQRRHEKASLSKTPPTEAVRPGDGRSVQADPAVPTFKSPQKADPRETARGREAKQVTTRSSSQDHQTRSPEIGPMIQQAAQTTSAFPKAGAESFETSGHGKSTEKAGSKHPQPLPSPSRTAPQPDQPLVFKSPPQQTEDHQTARNSRGTPAEKPNRVQRGQKASAPSSPLQPSISAPREDRSAQTMPPQSPVPETGQHPVFKSPPQKTARRRTAGDHGTSSEQRNRARRGQKSTVPNTPQRSSAKTTPPQEGPATQPMPPQSTAPETGHPLVFKSPSQETPWQETAREHSGPPAEKRRRLQRKLKASVTNTPQINPGEGQPAKTTSPQSAAPETGQPLAFKSPSQETPWQETAREHSRPPAEKRRRLQRKLKASVPNTLQINPGEGQPAKTTSHRSAVAETGQPFVFKSPSQEAPWQETARDHRARPAEKRSRLERKQKASAPNTPPPASPGEDLSVLTPSPQTATPETGQPLVFKSPSPKSPHHQTAHNGPPPSEKRDRVQRRNQKKPIISRTIQQTESARAAADPGKIRQIQPGPQKEAVRPEAAEAGSSQSRMNQPLAQAETRVRRESTPAKKAGIEQPLHPPGALLPAPLEEPKTADPSTRDERPKRVSQAQRRKTIRDGWHKVEAPQRPQDPQTQAKEPPKAQPQQKPAPRQVKPKLANPQAFFGFTRVSPPPTVYRPLPSIPDDAPEPRKPKPTRRSNVGASPYKGWMGGSMPHKASPGQPGLSPAPAVPRTAPSAPAIQRAAAPGAEGLRQKPTEHGNPSPDGPSSTRGETGKEASVPLFPAKPTPRRRQKLNNARTLDSKAPKHRGDREGKANRNDFTLPINSAPRKPTRNERRAQPNELTVKIGQVKVTAKKRPRPPRREKIYYMGPTKSLDEFLSEH